jgi:hypothetical protein
MEKRFAFENIFGILLAIVIVVGMSFGVAVVAMHKPDEVIRETEDFIYVKRYNIFVTDSTDYKIVVYNQPKIHDGVVIHKESVRYFHGVAGKGGHWVTRYNITIEFNGKTITYNNPHLYEKYDKGSLVKVKESWYNGNCGQYKIDIL